MIFFSSRRRHATVIAVLLLLHAGTLSAQAREATDTSQAQQTLFNKRDAWLAAGFAGLTVAMFPIDKHIETHLRDQTTPANRFFDRSAPGFEYVAPVMYGGATLVGLSRMFHNRHWASDVALGAGIGTFSGLKVVKYSHAHPDNMVDRIILHTTAAPDGRGGAYIIWSAPAPR